MNNAITKSNQTEMPAVTVSENWQYEDLAILNANGHRARGKCAVVVEVAEHDIRVFSWDAA